MIGLAIYLGLPLCTIIYFLAGMPKWGFFWLTLWVLVWGLFIVAS